MKDLMQHLFRRQAERKEYKRKEKEDKHISLQVKADASQSVRGERDF